jgi:hypothetical protein
VSVVAVAWLTPAGLIVNACRLEPANERPFAEKEIGRVEQDSSGSK